MFAHFVIYDHFYPSNPDPRQFTDYVWNKASSSVDGLTNMGKFRQIDKYCHLNPDKQFRFVNTGMIQTCSQLSISQSKLLSDG